MYGLKDGAILRVVGRLAGVIRVRIRRRRTGVILRGVGFEVIGRVVLVGGCGGRSCLVGLGNGFIYYFSILEYKPSILCKYYFPFSISSLTPLSLAFLPPQ